MDLDFVLGLKLLGLNWLLGLGVFWDGGPLHLFWAIYVMIGPYWAMRPINELWTWILGPFSKKEYLSFMEGLGFWVSL